MVIRLQSNIIIHLWSLQLSDLISYWPKRSHLTSHRSHQALIWTVNFSANHSNIRGSYFSLSHYVFINHKAVQWVNRAGVAPEDIFKDKKLAQEVRPPPSVTVATQTRACKVTYDSASRRIRDPDTNVDPTDVRAPKLLRWNRGKAEPRFAPTAVSSQKHPCCRWSNWLPLYKLPRV